ncbi:hypothetical protein HOP50_15g75540 [Chloropicon primus]|nr:hypothetical protein HOP50_15g75540 [Chloropicon primus]
MAETRCFCKFQTFAVFCAVLALSTSNVVASVRVAAKGGVDLPGLHAQASVLPSSASLDGDDGLGYWLSTEVSPKWLLAKCFSVAKTNITASVYKFSDKSIYEALQSAVDMNPELGVTLIVNDETLDHDGKEWLEHLNKSDRADIKLWKDIKDSGFDKLHAKFVICDDFVVLGSANWSENSCSGSNMEISVAGTSAFAARELEAAFQKLWANEHASSL